MTAKKKKNEVGARVLFSLNAINLASLKIPGRRTSGFYGPDRRRMHQARSVVMCSENRMEDELRSSKNHQGEGEGGGCNNFMHADGSVG